MRYFKHIYHNFPTKKLVEIAKSEGANTNKDGILTMSTGKFTGRSPKDRYFVEDPYSTQKVDFTRKINQKISINTFRNLKWDIINKLSQRPTYLSDKFAGNSKKNRIAFTLYTSSI